MSGTEDKDTGLSIRFVREFLLDADCFDARGVAEYPHRHYFLDGYCGYCGLLAPDTCIPTQKRAD